MPGESAGCVVLQRNGAGRYANATTSRRCESRSCHRRFCGCRLSFGVVDALLDDEISRQISTRARRHPVCLCSAMPARRPDVKHVPPFDIREAGWRPFGQAGGMATSGSPPSTASDAPRSCIPEPARPARTSKLVLRSAGPCPRQRPATSIGPRVSMDFSSRHGATLRARPPGGRRPPPKVSGARAARGDARWRASRALDLVGKSSSDRRSGRGSYVCAMTCRRGDRRALVKRDLGAAGAP